MHGQAGKIVTCRSWLPSTAEMRAESEESKAAFLKIMDGTAPLGFGEEVGFICVLVFRSNESDCSVLFQ